MNDIGDWLNFLQCPDCKMPVKKNPDSLLCSACGRDFQAQEGIWNFLPFEISDQAGKDKEKEGWTRKEENGREAGWEPPPEHFLALPDHPHPYYRAAAWYLRIVLEYGKPWTGKKVLELGAAECWGTRRFAESGAQAVALDYDPTRMRKGQILLDNLPIRFLRLRGDAECLPFDDQSLDVVFCCSVLHHFFNLERAVQEITRVLKPGGVFFGIHEAFHPPHYSREQILRMSEDTIPNIEAGINESSYTATDYRRFFQNAGLNFDLIHPRWDVRERGSDLVVRPGVAIFHNDAYSPEMFAARAGLPGMRGFLSRFMLRSGLWRIIANEKIFPFIRFQILNWTNKDKIIVAKKA